MKKTTTGHWKATTLVKIDIEHFHPKFGDRTKEILSGKMRALILGNQ